MIDLGIGVGMRSSHEAVADEADIERFHHSVHP
jgi:hypothetical protein